MVVIGVYVIVRGDRSGVFAGDLESYTGREVILRNARKLWFWDGAGAVEDIAVYGVTKPDNCKFTVTVDKMIITDAIQIIPATEEARKIIAGVKEWRQ